MSVKCTYGDNIVPCRIMRGQTKQVSIIIFLLLLLLLYFIFIVLRITIVRRVTRTTPTGSASPILRHYTDWTMAVILCIRVQKLSRKIFFSYLFLYSAARYYNRFNHLEICIHTNCQLYYTIYRVINREISDFYNF